MQNFQTHALSISEIPPFGNIDLSVPVPLFFMMGLRPGDAVDVEFSNGFAFRNMPVFSGLYGDGDKPCLYVASSLYPHVGIACPVNGSPWLMAGVEPGDTARIILRRRRGFNRLEKRMRLPELLRPTKDRSPQQNANWRSLSGGAIAPGTIYRSCSPIRSDSAGAPAACTLIEEMGIRSVLNLSDSPVLLQANRAKVDARLAPYLRLCDKDRVLPLHLGVDLSLRESAHTLAHGLLWLAEQPKPTLIHCKLGLDRTGAVCALLEMLSGCGYADVEHDYQASYFNLFGPPPNGRDLPLGRLRFRELIDFLLSFSQGGKGHDSENLYLAARGYLAFGGLEDEQIDRIEYMMKNEGANSGDAFR